LGAKTTDKIKGQKTNSLVSSGTELSGTFTKENSLEVLNLNQSNGQKVGYARVSQK